MDEGAREDAMKLGLLVKLAPSKIGSVQSWLLGMAEEAFRRGHTLDVFGLTPVHPQFEAQLQALGAGFSTLGELTSTKAVAVSRLATYDVLHLNLIGTHELPTLLACAAWPARLIFSDVGLRDPSDSRTERIVGRALDRLVRPRLRRVVGVSDFVRDTRLQRLGLGTSRGRTIHHGVDVRRFRPAKRHAGATAAVIPTHLGGGENGLEVLLRALELMKRRELRLLVGGDGAEREAARSLARTLGIAHRVEWVSDEDGDAESFLDEADIFVAPVLRDAGAAVAVAEGMAAGCAVIASRVGGLPEYVEHGRTGLLVDPSDPRALADALDDLVESPDFRRHLGRAARRRAEERFSLDRCVARHLDLAEELVREAKRERSPAPPRVPTRIGEVARAT